MKEILPVLQKLTEYEGGLKKVRLVPSVSFDVVINDTLDLLIYGELYKVKLNPHIIHQLGNRIFQNLGNSLVSINKHWYERIKNHKVELANEIKTKLLQQNATLLLDVEKNTLYGIISDQFCEINQLKFRSEFIDTYKTYGLSEKAANNNLTFFGEPREKFTFNANNFRKVGEPVTYGIGIIYGLNNGYSSFRIALDRTILVCKNGMTSVEKLHFAQLKHTKEYSIPAFIENIKNNIFEYDEFFQKVISGAKIRSINPNQVNELFARLHVTTVIKNRIKERFEIEKAATGENEWSLSQAFTYLATHFYKTYPDKHNGSILTEVGSNILDNSLEYVLDSSMKEYAYGEYKTYGNLMPRGFQNN